ncbi:MAG: tRNA lysidine(34) synthetase TilS [Nitrospirota bacterium]
MPENILITKIRRAIASHKMFAAGDTVACAVSGGPDSVAMLHGLLELKEGLHIKLAVAHLDHGFRDESAAEAEFVKGMAESLGLPFYTEKAGLKERLAGQSVNRQAAARAARYDFLERAADVLFADKIAVAHTADDQAETVLMRLLRGSGMSGLAGIPPVRTVDGWRSVVRPLIYASRRELENYLSENKIASVTDPSNLKNVYLRNRIRLELLPVLGTYNPRILEALARSAELLQADEEFLEGRAREMLESIVARREKGGESGSGLITLRLDDFDKLPEALKRRVVRLAVEDVKGDVLGLSYGHVTDAVRDIYEGPTGRGTDLPGGVRFERSYKKLLIYLPEEGISFSVPLPLPEEGEASGADVPEAGLTAEAEIVSGACAVDKNSALFDLGKMDGPLVIRSRRPGDFFYPAGMEGRKRLKTFFIDLKVPRMERARVPLLECAGEIAWVMGYRQDRRFIIGPDSKRILKVSFRMR